MDTGEEILGQARKDGKLGCDCGEPDCECGSPSETKRSDAPAIPYGNPPEASQDVNKGGESPGTSAFA